MHGNVDVKKGDPVQPHNDTDSLRHSDGHLGRAEPKGNCPSPESRSAFGEAHAKLTVRKIVVWERKATESLIKKTIAMEANNVLPNFVAGGMDAVEGTVRSCLEEELEELYNGRLGVLEGGSVLLGGAGGDQRAWLRIERGVTICGRRKRQTHLPHVNVEWNNPDRGKDSIKRYTAPAEESEFESMRLEWSYLEGRDSYRLRRGLQEAMTAGCWMKGTLAELKQLQAAGRKSTLGIARRFGQGHLVLRSGEVAYVARCGMAVVELRNQTICTQEIPVTFRGEEMYVEPISLVLQHSATLVRCREKTPP